MPAKTTKKSTKSATRAKATAKVKTKPKVASASVSRKKRATATKGPSAKTSARTRTARTGANAGRVAKSKLATSSKGIAAKHQAKVTVKRKSKAAAKRISKAAPKMVKHKPAGRKAVTRKAPAAKSHKISPNTITLIRILLAFVWLAACEIFIEPPAILTVVTTRFASISVAPLVLAGVFFLIALTDFFDGYFARKNGAVSNLGIFLDPIADKILVICGLLFLMQYGYVNIWAVLIIVAREFLVSGMRMSVAEKGVVVAASGIGKTKTALTMASVVGFLLYMGMPPLLLASSIVFWISQILLMFAIFFTIWSGLEYFAENKKYLV